MINVTLGEAKTQEKPFPKLMINAKGCIRLVYPNGDSTIMVSANGRDVFSYQAKYEWFAGDFTDYNAPITLQNA